MSIELQDLRAKVAIETDFALEAECAATGKDKSELVRDILTAWAEQRIHAAYHLTRRFQAEGIRPEPKGVTGNRGEAPGQPGASR